MCRGPVRPACFMKEAVHHAINLRTLLLKGSAVHERMEQFIAMVFVFDRLPLWDPSGG